jgi:ATP-binding cassette subfamily B protein
MAFGRDVRSSIFRKVESFSRAELDTFGTASLITRNTNDVQQVQQVVFMGLTIMVSAPILIVGGVIMALKTDVPLSGLLLVVVPLMGLVIGLVMARGIPLFRATQAKIDRINQVMRETLAGVRVIRAFVRVRHEEARFRAASEDLFDTQLAAGRLFAFTQPVIFAIFNLSTVAVLWFGAVRVQDGALSIGNLTAFLQYLTQILFAMLTAVFMFILVPRAAVSSERIREVLTTKPSIHDPDEPVTPDPASPDRGVVEFRHVEFGYPGADQPVLKELSFRAEPGRTTAIVGSTGSGKSTLVNQIPRFYDATAGRVLVDGVDVRDVTRRSLRREVGVISQDPFLFSATVRENIAFGAPDATDEQVVEAARAAQAHEFVEALPDGYETVIGERGITLSGGQRQRLAIARAILIDPRILVLDDATASVDATTEARIREGLAEVMKGRTTIIIAHRLSTIQLADEVVVLEHGRVAARGTQAELLEANEVYRELHEHGLLEGLLEEKIA